MALRIGDMVAAMHKYNQQQGLVTHPVCPQQNLKETVVEDEKDKYLMETMLVMVKDTEKIGQDGHKNLVEEEEPQGTVTIKGLEKTSQDCHEDPVEKEEPQGTVPIEGHGKISQDGHDNAELMGRGLSQKEQWERYILLKEIEKVLVPYEDFTKDEAQNEKQLGIVNDSIESVDEKQGKNSEKIIANIVQSWSKETKGEIELCAFYKLGTGRRDQLKTLADLATDSEVTRV